MIEKTVLDYLLSENISGIGQRVVMETPEDLDTDYILIEKTGSSEENLIRTATFAVQSCSRRSLLRAAEINEAAKGALDRMAEAENVYSCRLNTDYQYSSAQMNMYRYQAVYVITY